MNRPTEEKLRGRPACRLTVDPAVLTENYTRVREIVGPETQVAAVVKADGYGHGLETAACAFHRAGCRVFCITETSEGFKLRDLFGKRVRILKLVPSFPEEFSQSAALNLEEVIVSKRHWEQWADWCSRYAVSVRVHLKVDCGMGRLGFSREELVDAMESVVETDRLKTVGIMSHLPASEEDPAETPVGTDRSRNTVHEIRRFREIAIEMERRLCTPLEKHVANSAAALYHPSSRLDLVRVGLALYGVDPRKNGGGDLGIRPAMTLTARLVQVRSLPAGVTVGYGRDYRTASPMKVGVLPVGYALGYLRRYGDEAEVLVRGHRCKVLGRISMNLMVIDLGGLGEVRPGEKATLLGRDGEAEITPVEIAAWGETIPYEVLTTFGGLVPGRYPCPLPDSDPL